MKYLKEAWSHDKIDFIITTLWILFLLYMVPLSYNKYIQYYKNKGATNERYK